MLLLHILAAIGKILPWILIITAVLLLLILFVPVTYKADIRKQGEDLTAAGNVGWLLHAVHVAFSLDKNRPEEKVQLSVRIFGVPILPLIRRILGKIRKKKKTKRADGSERIIRWEAPKKPTVEPGQRREMPVEVVRTKRPNLIQRAAAHIQAFVGKIKKTIRRIRYIYDHISEWIDYLQSDSFSRAMECLLKHGSAILRHVKPRRIQGTVRFGTDDPAKTGMLIGCLYILYPVFPEKLRVEPEFLESCLEADIQIKGHLILFVLVYHAVRILLQKDVRKLISRIRGSEKKKTKKKNHKGRGKSWRKTMSFRTT